MSSLTVIKQKPKKYNKELYVYYDNWTGAIASIGHAARTNTDLPYFTTTDHTASRINTDYISCKNYIVSLDTDVPAITKKDNTVRLHSQEDNLVVLSDTKSSAWDIRIRFYTITNTMTVELNPAFIKQVAVLDDRSKLKIKSENSIELFITRKNQPDVLVDTVKINLLDLVRHPVVEIDITDIVKHTSYSDISVMTRRVVKQYCLEIIHAKYVSKNNQSHHNTIQTATNTDRAHLIFEQIGDRLVVSTSIAPEHIFAFGLQHKEIFYLVGDTPDQLIATIEVDITRLQRGKSEQFKFEFENINDYNIIHRNGQICVAKRKLHDINANN